jgi:hypothetical protein
VFQVLLIKTGNWVWVIPLMWSPAAASMVARLVLREDISDVSFRVGGRRGWQANLMAVVFPIVIGLTVYGIAWMTGIIHRLRCGEEWRQPLQPARRRFVVGWRVGCPDGNRHDHRGHQLRGPDDPSRTPRTKHRWGSGRGLRLRPVHRRMV